MTVMAYFGEIAFRKMVILPPILGKCGCENKLREIDQKT
jgi:hypothetical protein